MAKSDMKNIGDVEPKTVEPGPGNNPVKRKVTAVMENEKPDSVEPKKASTATEGEDE